MVEKIDTSDIPEVGEDWFARARLVKPGADVIRMDGRRFVRPKLSVRRRIFIAGRRRSDPAIQFVQGMMVMFFMWPLVLWAVCMILGIRFVPVIVP